MSVKIRMHSYRDKNAFSLASRREVIGTSTHSSKLTDSVGKSLCHQFWKFAYNL